MGYWWDFGNGAANPTWRIILVRNRGESPLTNRWWRFNGIQNSFLWWFRTWEFSCCCKTMKEQGFGMFWSVLTMEAGDITSNNEDTYGDSITFVESFVPTDWGLITKTHEVNWIRGYFIGYITRKKHEQADLGVSESFWWWVKNGKWRLVHEDRDPHGKDDAMGMGRWLLVGVNAFKHLQDRANVWFNQMFFWWY